jgi:hypothetical protein
VIVYELSCENSHQFEGWFSSIEDFERQKDGTLISCPLCGNDKVHRIPHASHVSTGPAQRPAASGAGQARNQQYANLDGDALIKLIDKIVENTEDVGRAFPEEARKIHYHEAPERHIRGTASAKEVEALKEEGVEVVALPIPAHRLGKTH